MRSTTGNAGMFIVGCPRSGTTLMQSILASHSQLHSAPETSFFSRLIPRLGVAYADPGQVADQAVVETLREDFRTMTGIELPVDFIDVSQRPTMREVFERLMAHFNEEDKPLWVEKTTLHARCLPAIKRFYPDMKVVNMIRDPVACAGSMSVIRPVSFGDFRLRYISSFYGYTQLWNECVTAALEFPFREQIMHVQYEALVKQPEETVQAVCRFLGIAFEPGMLETFNVSAKRVFSGDSCPWQNANLQNGISEAPLYRWRKQLGPARTWMVQTYTARLLREYGYYEELPVTSRISGLMRLGIDQLVRLFTATRVELIVRKLLVKVVA